MSPRPDITSVEAVVAWRAAVEGPFRRGDQERVAELVHDLRPAHCNAAVVLSVLACLGAEAALEAAGSRGRGVRSFTALLVGDDVPRPARFAGQMVAAAMNRDASVLAALAKTVVRISAKEGAGLFGDVACALVEIGSSLAQGPASTGGESR